MAEVGGGKACETNCFSFARDFTNLIPDSLPGTVLIKKLTKRRTAQVSGMCVCVFVSVA